MCRMQVCKQLYVYFLESLYRRVIQDTVSNAYNNVFNSIDIDIQVLYACLGLKVRL